jgi:hypothetical protein
MKMKLKITEKVSASLSVSIDYLNPSSKKARIVSMQQEMRCLKQKLQRAAKKHEFFSIK